MTKDEIGMTNQKTSPNDEPMGRRSQDAAAWRGVRSALPFRHSFVIRSFGFRHCIAGPSEELCWAYLDVHRRRLLHQVLDRQAGLAAIGLAQVPDPPHQGLNHARVELPAGLLLEHL